MAPLEASVLALPGVVACRDALSTAADLRLYDTQVSDAGLEHVFGLKNLILLDVRNTAVTNKGIERVRQALPRLSHLEGP